MKRIFLLGSTATIGRTFHKRSDFNDLVIFGNSVGAVTKTSFQGGVSIERTVEADPQPFKMQYHTVTTIHDEKNHQKATLTENTCWQRTTLSSEINGKQTTKELTGKTVAEKCSEIQAFFKDNPLVSTVFCASSKGVNIEEVLKNNGHPIVPQPKI